MSDRRMAANTGQLLRTPVRLDRLHDLGMTLSARLLGNRGISGRDPQWLGKPAGRERQGVMKAVDALGDVFPDNPWGRVAIVTDRDRMM